VEILKIAVVINWSADGSLARLAWMTGRYPASERRATRTARFCWSSIRYSSRRVGLLVFAEAEEPRIS
jgi:hypothetical protein